MQLSLRVFLGASVLLSASTIGAQAGVGFISKERRLELIRSAQVWAPADIEAKDIWAGPRDSANSLLQQATVTCRYVEVEKNEKISGATPKFRCKLSSGDVVKVKYGRKNGEIYAEPLATRLLWALGFPADKMYPTQVVCQQCPKDPWAVIQAAPTDTTVDRTRYAEVRFEDAVIERKFTAETLESKDDQGWKWPELELVSKEAYGAPRAELDALRLLQVFMQNSDTKAANQRLVCPKGLLSTSADGEINCAAPLMMAQDLGATFASGTGGPLDFLGIAGVQKVSLKGWRKRTIWHDDNHKAPSGFCKGRLERGSYGTLEDHPLISEDGRALLGGILARLSRQQIEDLFAFARVTARDKDTTVAEWADVFQDKVRQINQMNCWSHEAQD